MACQAGREAHSETLLLSTSCPLIAIITLTEHVQRAGIYYNYPFIKYLSNGVAFVIPDI